MVCGPGSITIRDRKSTRLHSSHTEIYALSLHDALPISWNALSTRTWSAGPRTSLPVKAFVADGVRAGVDHHQRSEEHTSALQSHRDLRSFPTRRSSDLLECTVHANVECRPSYFPASESLCG